MRIAASARIVVAVLACVVGRPAEAQQSAPSGYPAYTLGVRVPKAVLERYTGEYVYPDGNTIMVRLIGDTIYREIPGQIVPFVPITETRFRLGPVFTAEFVIDKAGGVTQILSDGVAVEFRLLRKGTVAAVPPTPPAAVRVPRSVLQQYVGHYEYLPGQMGRNDLYVEVRLKGDTLIALGSGLRNAVLTPISETRFRLGSTAIEWEFASTQGSGVTLIMGSGIQQMRAGLIR